MDGLKTVDLLLYLLIIPSEGRLGTKDRAIALAIDTLYTSYHGTRAVRPANRIYDLISLIYFIIMIYSQCLVS